MIKKLPLVFQHDLMDCGAAVLLIVARFFEVRTDYRYIRSKLLIGPDGATISDLLSMAEKIGFEVHPIEYSSLDVLRKEKGIFLFCTKPEIVSQGFGHYVVVRFLSDGHCEVSDPSNGVVKVTLESLVDRFHTQALLFPISNQELITQASDLRSFEVTDVKRIFGKFKITLFVLALLTLIGSALSILPSYLFGIIVDDLIMIKEKKFNWSFLFLYVFVTGFRDFIGVYKSYIFGRFGNLFSMNLTGVLIRRVLNLNWKQFSSRKYGDYTNRFSAVEEFKELASEIVGSTLGQITTLILAGLTIALIDVRLLYFSFFMGLFALLINLYAANMRLKFSYQMNIQSSGTGSNVYELLSLKKWIMLNNASGYFFRRWSRLTKKLLKMNLVLQKNSMKWSIVRVLNSIFLEFSGIALVVYLYQQGALTAGKLVTVISLQAVVISTMSSFDSLKVSSRSAKLSYDRLLDLFTDIPNQIASKIDLRLSKDSFSKITIRDVCFSYRGEANGSVLTDVTIELLRNQITVIKGRSGTGKSTVLGVVAGVLHPYQGKVVFDDRYEMDFDQLRRLKLCTFVDQEYRFFDGTILDNLTLGHRKDPAIVEKLLKDAGLLDEIRKFTKGVYSEISDASRGFSGGQLQRLSVIRALLTDKPIIILDEPTSALDAESERKICDLLIQNKNNKIILISAHSPVVEKIADQLIQMELISNHEPKHN